MRRKGNPGTLLVGLQTGVATVENSMEFPQKTKNIMIFFLKKNLSWSSSTKKGKNQVLSCLSYMHGNTRKPKSRRGEVFPYKFHLINEKEMLEKINNLQSPVK